jgi:serine/threonine protein phosphatase PrpC
MGEFLSVPIKDKKTEERENDILRYASCGMQGWRKRMEDSHIADLDVGGKGIFVFGVFDGHGGKEVAQWVKKNFSNELSKNSNFKSGNYQKALIENFLRMDNLMEEPQGKLDLKEESKRAKLEDEVANKDKEKNKTDLFRSLFDPKAQEDCDVAMYTGCTATVCLLDDKFAYFANAGDSRIVISKNGKAYAMTEDHKPENEEERKRIYKANGFVSDGRVNGNLNLSRSLGDLEYKKNKKIPQEEQIITAYPEITNCSLSDVDFIFLGCDGVYDCLTNQEVVDFISTRLKSNMKLAKILEEMMDQIIAPDIYTETGVGCDNMSAVIIIFKKK